MAKDLNIDPLDPGLSLAARQELEAARRGGALEQVLGGIGNLPARISAARRQAAQRAALQQFASTGELPEGFTPENLEQAISLRKLKEPKPTRTLSLDQLLADRVQKGELTLERALELKKKSGGHGQPSGLKPPPGFKFTSEGTLEAIPGGPAFIKAEEKREKARAKEEAIFGKANRVVAKVDQAIGDVGFFTTGIPGRVLSRIPGRKAFDLKETIVTIKANLGFDELQKMRDASPTGGALGQVALQELDALQKTVASLEIGQSEEQLLSGLNEIKAHYERWKNSVRLSGGTPGKAVRQTGQSQPTGLTPEQRRARIAELRKKQGR